MVSFYSVGLQCMMVVFLDHSHLLFQETEKTFKDTLLLGTYCGTTAPPVFVSQNIFIIVFVSDISNSGRGFHAGFYKLEGMWSFNGSHLGTLFSKICIVDLCLFLHSSIYSMPRYILKTIFVLIIKHIHWRKPVILWGMPHPFNS